MTMSIVSGTATFVTFELGDRSIRGVVDIEKFTSVAEEQSGYGCQLPHVQE